jgi:hypothetical protein
MANIVKTLFITFLIICSLVLITLGVFNKAGITQIGFIDLPPSECRPEGGTVDLSQGSTAAFIFGGALLLLISLYFAYKI